MPLWILQQPWTAHWKHSPWVLLQESAVCLVPAAPPLLLRLVLQVHVSIGHTRTPVAPFQDTALPFMNQSFTWLVMKVIQFLLSCVRVSPS